MSPVDIVNIIICIRGDAMSLAPSLINLGDTFSNPAALLEFCLLRIASTFLGDFIKIKADL